MQNSASSSIRRNSYIDYIKFVFAIIIVFFHAENGILPGGRSVVEGFFMISGYLMMNSIARDRQKDMGLGSSTLHFINHKYTTLLTYLLPSALLGVIAYAIIDDMTRHEVLKKLPLLFFEIVPLQIVGFRGWYTVGISWYLSAMLFSLAILYPLCRKYGEDFTLTIGIPISLFLYGFLSYKFGNLAVHAWEEGIPVRIGMLRGFAGCLAGCVLYEFVQMISRWKLTNRMRWLAFVLEICGYMYFFYSVQYQAKSEYDYLLVFLLFVLLLIGISGISVVNPHVRYDKSRVLGTWSTLIVMNHFQWDMMLRKVLGLDYAKGQGFIYYWLLIIGSCLIVWIVGMAGRKLIHRCVTELTR